LDRRLAGPQNRTGRHGEEKIGKEKRKIKIGEGRYIQLYGGEDRERTIKDRLI
jgi:hypothetical protein